MNAVNKENKIIQHAKMTFLAQKDPYGSVRKVFPDIINAFLTEQPPETPDIKYIGVKDVRQIPPTFIEKLKQNGNFRLHTIDAASLGGRAIDLNLKNPLTGRPMTGSSSGTAINVFLGINELGVGSDGGGSVLAPAMSLNLFGFICPLMEKDHMAQFRKDSTDRIAFTPSLGLISRTWAIMKDAIGIALNNQGVPTASRTVRAVIDRNEHERPGFPVDEIDFPDILGQRAGLIDFLKTTLRKCDFLISYEGPVDLEGFGDSIFGHFDHRTADIQRAAAKGLIRVANMADATALCIPSKELGCGSVLLCESAPEKIAAVLDAAGSFMIAPDELSGRYFLNHDLFWAGGYGN